ncbi:nickel-dependent hydrogenase large subunit [Thiolapillus sp.]
MSRRITGAFNRVEGDLEVKLEVDGGQVRNAWVVSPMYRGFEKILSGKPPGDALVYVPRICGICSVAQSVAAAQALAQLQGITPTDNGQLATNLVLACENLADHLTHFYLFFMPDFAHKAYTGADWFTHVQHRFKAVTGEAMHEVLPARAAFMHITELLAGKWPHTLAIQPGGTTVALESRQKLRMQLMLFQFRMFLEKTLFGDNLENVSSLDSVAALEAWRESPKANQSDFACFLQIADTLGLEKLGCAYDRFISYGAYPQLEKPLFAAGIWTRGEYADLNPGEIREDLSHAWMQGALEPLHPREGITQPAHPEKVYAAYTWCKAPRIEGKAAEVGALARQLVDGHPLIQDLVKTSGGNVRNRVIARLLEIALLIPVMEDWVKELRSNEPYCTQGKSPDEGHGYGMIEAARGSLGHWLEVHNGRIQNYQIIAPTTWNFSPRDRQGTPGPLEQALVGAPVEPDATEPVSVQHIVRSFDPCMVCTVH